MSEAMSDAERTEKSRKKLRKEELCIRCRRADARTLAGKMVCGECYKKQSEYQKAKRQERIAKGLCSSCGKNRPESGRTCEACRIRSREDCVYSRAKKKREKEK